MDFFENKKNVKTVHSKSCRLSSIYSGAGNSIKQFFQQSHTVGITCPHLTDAGSEVWVGGRYVMGPGLPCASGAELELRPSVRESQGPWSESVSDGWTAASRES